MYRFKIKVYKTLFSLIDKRVCQRLPKMFYVNTLYVNTDVDEKSLLYQSP